MITLFKNLIIIVTKIPAIITIVKTILDVLGSDNTIKFFEQIKKAFDFEAEEVEVKGDEISTEKFINNVKKRLGLAYLNVSSGESFIVQNNESIGQDKNTRTS
jgi:hypothetical protein